MNSPRDTENYEPFIPIALIATLVIIIAAAYFLGAFS